MFKNMNFIDWTALFLLIIGGLNWGLVGLANYDLVASLFGSFTTVSRIIYTAIGLSGAYATFLTIKKLLD